MKILFECIVTKNSSLRSKCFRSLTTETPKPFKDIPGLKAVPVLGTIHHFLPIIGSIGIQRNLSEIFRVMGNKYGPIVKWEGTFGRESMVLFFNPKDYEKVHRAEETNPFRPGFQALEHYRKVVQREKYDGVHGLSTAQGSEWRDFRTKVNPAIMKVKLGRVYTRELEEIAEESISRIFKMSPEDLTENFDSEISKWSLETIALISLGARLGCLDENLGENHPSRKLLFCSKEIPNIAFKIEFSPAVWKKDKSKTTDFKKILEVFETQFSITETYINEAKKKLEGRGEIAEEDQRILERLLAIDDKVAVMMANEMIIAGVDTVSFTLTSLLYQLAINQESQERVRQEFRSQKGLRFFKACLKESMRMTPVVPANTRLTTKDHVVGGYHIPKGVFAMSPNEVLSTQESHYVRANEFLPERWLVDKTHPLYHGNTHPMVTLPFGFGVRACIGRRIAEMEVEVFVKKLLEKYNLTWSGPPIQVATKLTNAYTKPFNFKLDPLKLN